MSQTEVCQFVFLLIYGPFIFQGRMHVDPHPGNFLLMPDGRLGILDGGAIKQFSPAFMSAQRAMFESAYTRKPLDVLSVVKTMGVTSDLPEEIFRTLMTDVWQMIGAATASEEYDFSQDETVRWVKDLAKKHSLDFLKIRPPQEAVMFFRATSGMQQNLRQLGARGNIREIYRELAEDVASSTETRAAER